MGKLKLFFACLLMAVLSIGQVWADQLYFEGFEENHRTSGNNSYAAGPQVYGDWSLAYADAVTSGSPLTGTAHVLMRVAKNTTNSPSLTSEELLSSNETITKVSWNCKGQTTQTLIVSYSTDGSTWTEGFSESMPTSKTAKEFSLDNVVGPIYLKFLVSVASSTTSNRDANIDDITIEGTTSGGTKTLSSITISGNPTKTSYYAGQDFDPAGLVVTGTYSDASSAPISSGITWSYNPSQTLALNQTSIGVTATVDNISSEEVTISSLSVTEAPAVVNYEKVTAEPADWSGEYLIVYENGASAHVWTGIDAVNCYVAATISSDVIAQPEGTSSVTIASMDGGYSILVNGGTNDGKYIQNNGNSNGIKFVDAGVANTLTYENDAVTITCGGKKFRYNNNSNNDRFRYFGSDQQVIQLYKKVSGTVKPAAGLAYDDVDKKNLVKLGDAFTAPTLINPHSVAVTYASSNTDVAEVAANGAVTIKAAGVAVITASFDGNDDYKAGSASYTIGVTTHAGTEADPYVAADAKIAIDAKGTVENAYATGVVSNVVTTELPAEGYITFYFSADGLTSGQQIEAFKCLGLNSAQFEAVTDVVTGATVVVTGNLKKYNSTYEFDQNCHLVSYTAPAAPKTPIANDQAHPYTVAEAITFAADGVTYDLNDYVYVQGVVYDVKSFNSTNGTLDIYIKDANAENQFELFKCAGINDGNETTAFTALTDVQSTNIVIAYGQLTVFNSMSELKQGNYLVDLQKPVTAVEMDATAEVEVGSTVTLTAVVMPSNADQSLIWSVVSGGEYASVQDGVVSGVAEGEAVIRAASTDDPTKYSDCTVTITAADPTKHVVTFDATVDKGESPLSKSNITFTCSNGVLNNASEYRLYQNSTTTFACSAGNILKIEFTGVSGKPVSGFEDPEVGTLVIDGNDGVWTGNATSVSFVASGAQVRATEIKVTYKEDNRADAGIAFTPENVSITQGESWTKPSFINPNGLTVSFNSDNTSVASVSNEGVVALEGGIGTAVITATFDGDDTYKPATITYTITVNAPLSPWAYVYTSNLTLAVDDNDTKAYAEKVKITVEEVLTEFPALRAATGSAAGTCHVIVPAGTQTLHFHAAAWNNKTSTITVKMGETTLLEQPITADAGINSNSPYTLEGNAYEYYYSIDLSSYNLTEETRITFSAASGKQSVFFGVNQEGGVVPVLQSLAISGDLDTKTYEAGQAIDPTGLTVTGTYDVGAPADVTSQVEEWLYDALEAGDESVTISARIGNIVSPGVEITGLTVTEATPTITVSPTFWNFNNVDQGAVVAGKAITVTLTNVAAATVALSGTGADGFTVDQDALTASGTIVITPVTTTVGSFNATVTISDDAGVAADATITLMMNVQEADADDDLSGTWTLVTDPAQLIPGSRVIIAQYVSEDGAIKTMSTQANNNRTAVESTVAGTTLSPAAHTRVMTVEIPEAGKFALRTNRNTYLYAASSSSNQLKEEPTLNDNGKWTISIDANGGAIITASGDHTRNVMRYNPNNGSPIFACYASSSTTGALVAIYARQADYTRNDSWMAPGELGTVCIEHGATVAGAQIYELAGKSGGGVVFASVTTMEPGKPYLFQALSTRVDFFFTSATPAGTPDNSGAMKGTFVNLDITGTDLENTYYVVGHKLYGTADLTTLNIPAYRAYVKMDEVPAFNSSNNAPGRHYIVMGVNGTNNATGVDNLNAEDAPVKKLVNGHLFIIRGEKTFDATGRLVK